MTSSYTPQAFMQLFLDTNVQNLFPFSSYMMGIVLLFLSSLILKVAIFSHYKKNDTAILPHCVDRILSLFTKPMLVFSVLYGVYIIGLVFNSAHPTILTEKVLHVGRYLIDLLIVLWCLKNLVGYFKNNLLNWLVKTKHPLLHIVFTVISNSL